MRNPPELNFVDVYAKALDRLGDPRPAQRVGAVHTLEVLAQGSPAHRQAIVDVFCALLRAPLGGHGPLGSDGPIRAAILRTLTSHLRPYAGSAYWPGCSLDLTGASLVDLDLTGCHIGGGLGLDGAVLLGQAKLRGLIVGGPVSMVATTFPEHAWFERSVFHSTVRADGVVFKADAWFGETMFAGAASLRGAEFGGHAWFGNATFRGRLDLSDAVFRRSTGLRGAMFYQGIAMNGTTFLGPARVSRRDDAWNVASLGWRVVVDPDNAAVGQLLWIGHGALIEPTAV